MSEMAKKTSKLIGNYVRNSQKTSEMAEKTSKIAEKYSRISQKKRQKWAEKRPK